MFTVVFSIRLRLGVQWVSLLRHHNVLIMMIYYSGYYNIVATRNASQQGMERIFLPWWHTSVISGGGGGAERRMFLLWWDTLLLYFCLLSPVSICPAGKKLNWFLQGNKAERRSLPLFQIYRVQVVVTQYNYLLRAHQTLHVTEFNIHLNIFIAGQAVRAGLNMKP